ncbi:DoxX family protein [Lysobacter xanthus]
MDARIALSTPLDAKAGVTKPSVVARVVGWLSDDVLALLSRGAVALTFWISGQTKVEGFVVDPISGMVHPGIPHLSDAAIDLFRDEYALPLLPPELAATLAATAEHVFPVLLILGLATRLSALALLGMTLVIEVFVYPLAYPTHLMWAVPLLLLLRNGAGRWSLDALVARRRR